MARRSAWPDGEFSIKKCFPRRIASQWKVSFVTINRANWNSWRTTTIPPWLLANATGTTLSATRFSKDTPSLNYFTSWATYSRENITQFPSNRTTKLILRSPLINHLRAELANNRYLPSFSYSSTRYVHISTRVCSVNIVSVSVNEQRIYHRVSPFPFASVVGYVSVLCIAEKEIIGIRRKLIPKILLINNSYMDVEML